MVYNVFFKHICILVMAEGGYDPTDPTTEKTTLIPDTGDDDDDDAWGNVDWNTPVDPEDPDRTQPFEPGGASTPAGGESIPMTTRTRLPQERGHLIDETSFGGDEPTGRIAWQEIREEFEMADESKLKARYKEKPRSGGAILEVSMRGKDKWYALYTKSLGDTEKTFNKSIPKEIQNALGIPLVSQQGPGDVAMGALKALFPDAKDVEAYLDKTTKRLMIKKPGADQPSYPLYATEANPNSRRLNPEIPPDLRAALGESALDQATTLQQERDTNLREIVQKRNKLVQLEEAAQEVQERRQDLKNLRDRLKRLDDDIRELEDKAGPLDEEAIQRLKDEKKALEAEHQRKREQLDQANADAKTALQLQVEINDIKLANRDIERQINKLGIKVRKPLEELQQDKADLEKRLAENKQVLADKNASPSNIEAARKQVEQDERALERVNENIEREEQKLPLRERVKNIFKKYGWTLQVVALAVGIVISALALAATNGLKAGTKALGNGLKAIGQKLGSLLPGLIGSIVSYIFKAAGSVLSFLGEHAWLLILAVVTFFMERLLKMRRR